MMTIMMNMTIPRKWARGGCNQNTENKAVKNENTFIKKVLAISQRRRDVRVLPILVDLPLHLYFNKGSLSEELCKIIAL